MTTGRRLAVGSIWLFGSQLVGFLGQFLYAAVAARMVLPVDFGVYAVALAAIGLLSVVSNGGIGQAILRYGESSDDDLRQVVGLSSLVGAVSAVALLLGANFWAAAWGAQGATVIAIRWLSLSGLIGPYIGALLGLLRSRGDFIFMAIAQILSNILGSLLGLGVLVAVPSGIGLVASLVIAQFILVVLLCWRVGRCAIPLLPTGAVWRHVRFGGAVTLTNIGYYVLQTLPKWTVGRELGGGLLGYWNRAEVLTLLPMQSAQTAMLQTVYPEFVRHRDSDTLAETWTDMLSLSGWITIPFGVILALGSPVLVNVVYGPNYESASGLGLGLGLCAAVIPMSSLLAAGLEARSEFRVILLSQISTAALDVLLMVLLWNNWTTNWAMMLFAVSLLMRFGLQFIAAGRMGLVLVGRCSVQMACIAIACVSMVLWVEIWGLVLDLELGFLMSRVIGLTSLFVLVSGAIFLAGERIPALKLAKSYGIGRAQ